MDTPTGREPELYWDRAGEQSYAQAMYRSADVESHVRGRLWNMCLDIADQLQVARNASVLDYGCGDGAFANLVLSPHYQRVEGLDLSEKAIERANREAPANASYRAADLTSLDYSSLGPFDAAFLIGILHHIKQATPDVLKSLTSVTSRMVVLEPNGNHIVRKLLEFTPTYRAAGEDSFRKRELVRIFEAAGWQVAIARRVNLFPNFTPGPIYRLLRRFEPAVEASSFWSALCTVDLYGLKRAA
jgi:2-polyprenyl-3-methyl-5-hydroxy-6-metoxy-1,4-benzoquinol methylase